MKFELSNADGSARYRFAKNAGGAGLTWIRGNRPHKRFWPLVHFCLRSIFVIGPGQQDGVRHTAAVDVSKTSVRIFS